MGCSVRVGRAYHVGTRLIVHPHSLWCIQVGSRHVVRPGVFLIVGVARTAVRTKLFELISPNGVRIWKAWKEKSTEGARGMMYILWSIGTERTDL